MKLSAELLPIEKVSAKVIPASKDGKYPEKSGFAIGGMWVNGSDSFKSLQEFYNACMGQELIPAPSGKSLVLVAGDYTPVDTDFLSKIVTPRLQMSTVDLNDLI